MMPSFKRKSDKKKELPTDLALKYFDTYVSPLFPDKRDWPSIRIALLSKKKYCALLNNFADKTRILSNINEMGALRFDPVSQTSKSDPTPKSKEQESTSTCNDSTDNNLELPSFLRARQPANTDSESERGAENVAGGLDYFVPTTQIKSEMLQFAIDEGEQAIPKDYDDAFMRFMPDVDPLINGIDAYYCPPGNISNFPRPKRCSSSLLLEHYPLDAASLLPVLALNVRPGDRVLDLCAAPGGKSLAILQSAEHVHLHCNDINYARLNRLKSVLDAYLPQSALDLVSHSRRDGLTATFPDTPFDRVLVDVPCLADRHCLTEPDNNIFSPRRKDERLDLPKLQANLLCRGLSLVKPGGTVVYSTCTLLPAQNDGVVHAALETVWKKSNSNIIVTELTNLRRAFSRVFRFSRRQNARYGLLVLPNLLRNFGPAYVAKFKRLS